MNEDNDKKMGWSLTQEEWRTDELKSLSSFILNSGHLLQKNDVLLAVNVLCTKLKTLSGSDFLYVGEACRLLIKNLSKHFEDGSIEGEYVVDIVSCLVAGVSLPQSYKKCLTSEIHYQATDVIVGMSYPSTQCYISQKEILMMNAICLLEKVPMAKILSLLMPQKLLDPFQSAVAHRSFPVNAQLKSSDVPSLRHGLSEMERLLSLDLGTLAEQVVELVSRVSNAVVLMIASLAKNLSVEEMQSEPTNICCTAAMSIHLICTEIAARTIHARTHLTNSTEVFVFSINELLKVCKLDTAYVFTNRFLMMLPVALPFLAFIPSALYVGLWTVAKEALQHALRLGEATLKKSISHDSSDDPAASVGDWLENVLNDVPALMDQQEAAMNSQKATFVVSSVTLLDLCQRSLQLLFYMGSRYNIWTSKSFDCFLALCGACGGEHGYCSTENVEELLTQILEQAIKKDEFESQAMAEFMSEMLYFPKGENSKIVTTDPFSMKVVAVCAVGKRRATDVVLRLLNTGEVEPESSSLEHPVFRLLKCLTDAMNIGELKMMVRSALQTLYDTLESNKQNRAKIKYLLQAVHLMLTGGQSCGDRCGVLTKFKSSVTNRLDLSKPPKWESMDLVRVDIGFDKWEELQQSYINWIFESSWSEEHLPSHVFLLVTGSFLLRINNNNVSTEERCHFIRIRPLLLDEACAAYINKFNGGEIGSIVADAVKVNTLITCGLQLLADYSLIDLSSLPFIYYEALLLFFNQIKQHECSGKETAKVVEFAEGMNGNALSALMERAGVVGSYGAYIASLSISKCEMLNSVAPQARNDLQSLLPEELSKIVNIWFVGIRPEMRVSSKPAMLDFDSSIFQPPSQVCSPTQDIKKQMLAALCSLSESVAKFILNHLGKRQQAEVMPHLQWIVAIHCSELTSSSVRELLQTITSKLDISVLTSRTLAYVVSKLVDGILAEQSSSQTNLRDGPSVFSSVLTQLVISQGVLASHWSSVPDDLFSSLFCRIAEDPSLEERSVPLINLLNAVFIPKNVHMMAKLLKPMESHPELLLRWVNASESPLKTFCSLKLLIEHFVRENHGKVSEQSWKNILDGIVDVIFASDVYRKTAENSTIEVRKSDRWMYASLAWQQSDDDSQNIKCYDHRQNASASEANILSRALQCVIHVGGSKMHPKLIERCCLLFADLMDAIRDEGLQVIRGTVTVPQERVKQLVYAFVFMCNILDYISAVCRSLSPGLIAKDETDDPSVQLTTKHFVKKQSAAASKSRSLPLCTFAVSANQFVQQHWYSCYTCNMYESEGVCSVCAVNCHRGHDLSYNKFGSFFCDCGAKGCAALKSVSYPQPRRVSTQKYAAFPSNRSKHGGLKSATFHHFNFSDEEKDNVLRQLNCFVECLAKNKEVMVELTKALKAGSRLRSLRARKERLKEAKIKLKAGFSTSSDRIIMEPLNVLSKVTFDKKFEVSRAHNLISLINVGSSMLFAFVQDNSKVVLINIHAVLNASSKNFEALRLDLESTKFRIIAMAPHNDFLAVCGFKELLVLRVNKDGDASERQIVRFAIPLSSGHNTKMTWMTHAGIRMVAIASQQFVRIYDLDMDPTPSSFEFVLPLGDVTDFAFGQRNDGSTLVFVLSSAGHLYMEELEKARCADEGSYFMTVTVPLANNESAVSLHFSQETGLIFVSLASITYVGFFDGTNVTAMRQLPLEHSLTNWCEFAGIFAAVAHPPNKSLYFFYLQDNVLHIQNRTLSQNICAQRMLLGSDCVSQILVQVGDGNGDIQCLHFFRSCWQYEPDFWIRDIERCMLETELRPCASTGDDEVQEADLVTVFEECRLLQKVEFCSKALQLIYDSVELTKRLTSHAMTVYSLKHKEFDIVVKNLDSNYIICGLRVEVTKDKCPSTLNVLGKKINLQTNITRSFDIPLTRKQSISCNNEILLSFVSNTVPVQVLSIKVYGKTKKEFGFPSASYRFEPVITVPEHFVACYVGSCAYLKTTLKSTVMDWLTPNVLRLVAPGFESAVITRRASSLLHILLPNIAEYHDRKDAVLFASLIDHHRGGTLQLSIFSVLAVQLKWLALQRAEAFHGLMKRYFGDAIVFLKICFECIIREGARAEVVLDCFLTVSFMYMASCDDICFDLISLIIEILFSKDYLLAVKCKQLLGLIVAGYCTVCVQNHNQLFNFNGGLMPGNIVERVGASETGQQYPRFIPSVVFALSSAINKEYDIRSTPSNSSPNSLTTYFKETKWVSNLLLAIVHHLDRSESGTQCVIPAQTVVFLIGQHAPDQLFDVIIFLISGIDFGNTEFERTATSERIQIILRLLCVILVQSTSHDTDWRAAKPRSDAAKDKDLDVASKIVQEKSAAGEVSDESRYEDGDADEESDLEQMESENVDGIGGQPCLRQPNSFSENESVIATSPQITLALHIAQTLVSAGALDFCYSLLKRSESQWGKQVLQVEQSVRKLSRIPPEFQPDLLPLFNTRSFNINIDSLFTLFPLLQMEIALRLPYQLRKLLGSTLVLDDKWESLLCVLVAHESTVVRRSARKLLALICDSDMVRYREVRDEHIIRDLLNNLKRRLKNRTSLEYFELSDIVSRINGIALLSERQCNVWQKICDTELPWVMELACIMPDVASNAALNLVILAIRMPEKSDGSNMYCKLADTLLSEPKSFGLFKKLVSRFLFGENEERRWMLHGMLRALLQLACRPNQLRLVTYLYDELWTEARGFGKRAVQLVDILSYYLPRFLSKDELSAVYLNSAEIINNSLIILEAERNTTLFTKLREHIGSPNPAVFRKNPCLICSNSERQMEQMKISSIRLDSRFTTSAQMIKLMGHFEVSRLLIRLSEIKRSKMVKRLKFYCCSKVLESAVDLKNRPDLWEKAADVKVAQGETEIDIKLPIPIVTCNVVLEMAEFYESSSANSSDAPEYVHCPRCSTSVAPNPGICSNCGENVFQCVKCRAINYDEKEPFLCNSCGYCKYARLEAVLVGRSLPSAQSIENDSDRKLAEEQLYKLVQDIETTRCQIGIISKLAESRSWVSEPDSKPNMYLKYISRESFAQFMNSLNLKEDGSLTSLYRQAEKLHQKLCEQARQLSVFRSELIRYDIENGDGNMFSAARGFFVSKESCVDCISALVIHCVSLIRAACSNADVMHKVVSDAFVFGKLVNGCKLGSGIAHSIRSLIWNLAEANDCAAQKMCTLVQDGMLPCYLLTKSFFEGNYRFWEQKLCVLMRMAVLGSGDTEVDLHVLAVLCQLANVNARSTKDRAAKLAAPEGKHTVEPSGSRKKSITSGKPDTVLGSNESKSCGKKDLIVDVKMLRAIRKRIDETAKEVLEIHKTVISKALFPVTAWLQGKFIWTEYSAMLAEKDERSGKHAQEYLKSCRSVQFDIDVDAWLKKCMFSPVAAVRTATYRLLVTFCFDIRYNGTADVGSPVDIAHLLERVLLWLRDISNVPGDRLDEYFYLIASLLSVDEIRDILLSKYIKLHVDISKRLLVECMNIAREEQEAIPGDLSTGCRLQHLLGIIDRIMVTKRQGWDLLCESAPTVLPLILRSACALAQVVLHQTFDIEVAKNNLNVLIIRIAVRMPILVLNETTQLIKEYGHHRVQAYLITTIGNIIYPLVRKEEDFQIQIDKDPLQEDYLQGRMLGNPYKNTDSGMGPLMRDIKNKICRDCELVALLDDDNGMELLVNQQIIALDLPVADVYEKLWKGSHPGQPLTIMYRMRGLLGDATEPFIKTLNACGDKEKVDESQLRLASSLGNKLKAFPEILSVLDTLQLTGGGIQLLKELHKLLSYCIKVKGNREQLIEYRGIRRFLRVFEIIHHGGVRDETLETIALQYLELCKILLVDVLATDQKKPSVGGASFEQMSWLLELSMETSYELSAPLLEAVTSIAPNLCLGNEESMDALVETFRPCCRWDEFDQDRAFREKMLKKMDTLCKITSAIHDSPPGRVLKNKMIEANMLSGACDYLAQNHPPIFNVSVAGPEWKQFLGKPSLKYVLRLLAGLARAHEPSQEAIARASLPILHRLEQISSSEHIGTLAENVMEELKRNDKVATQIEKVRQETRAKKRQLAMAMREKQLTKLGMFVGSKGQVKVSARKISEPHSLESIPDVGVCCICREAVDASEKIMMVYAFASRLNLNSNMTVSDRNHTFTTVSQMNLVHLECHSTAIRMAGSRDEWASAALHNANTKCNVIVPIWSKKVKDCDMEHSFQRLSNDLEAAVDCGLVNLDTLSLDISELLDRFVKFRSFSALSHGGGRESNLQYMCLLVLLVQYLRKVSPSNVPSNGHNFMHQLCHSLIMDGTGEWNSKRLTFIKQLYDADQRWENSKNELFAWIVVDTFQNKICRVEGCDRAQYMRDNIISMLERCSEFVSQFDETISRANNFNEFLLAAGVSVEDFVFV